MIDLTKLSANIEYPHVAGADAEAKTEEIARYLFQLVEQLNFMFNDIYKNEAEMNDTLQAVAKKLKEVADGTV